MAGVQAKTVPTVGVIIDILRKSLMQLILQIGFGSE